MNPRGSPIHNGSSQPNQQRTVVQGADWSTAGGAPVYQHFSAPSSTFINVFRQPGNYSVNMSFNSPAGRATTSAGTVSMGTGARPVSLGAVGAPTPAMYQAVQVPAPTTPAAIQPSSPSAYVPQ